MTPRQRIREIAVELFGEGVGCGAALCVFGDRPPTGGMVTGSIDCRCRIDWKVQRLVETLAARLAEAEAKQDALAEVAETLCGWVMDAGVDRR